MKRSEIEEDSCELLALVIHSSFALSFPSFVPPDDQCPKLPGSRSKAGDILYFHRHRNGNGFKHRMFFFGNFFNHFPITH